MDPECVEVFADRRTDAELDRLIEKGLEDIAKAKADLEAEKELVINSQRRVDQNAAEETRLANRIKAALGNGDPQGTAKEFALSLAHVREQLASNAAQLATHKANYEAFAKSVEAGQRRVLEAKRKAKDLGLELKVSEREAKLAGLAEEFNASDAASRSATRCPRSRIGSMLPRPRPRWPATSINSPRPMPRTRSQNNKPRPTRFWRSLPRSRDRLLRIENCVFWKVHFLRRRKTNDLAG